MASVRPPRVPTLPALPDPRAGGPGASTKDPARAFLEAAIQGYFQGRPSLTVASVEAREWMRVDFDRRVRRHLAYPSREALHEAVFRQPPLHLYHSVARYRDPSPSDMGALRKGWLGSDLLADIDCKPAPSAHEASMGGLAAAWTDAKKNTLRLLHILRDELGVPARDCEVAFSGSKGYHVVLSQPEVQALDGAARRELAIYLTGRGAQLELLEAAARDGNNQVGGLAGRIARGFRLLRDLQEEPTKRTMTRHERIQTFPQARALTCPVALDVQVLGNVAGMRRVPGSVNAKTGLLCQPINGGPALEAFDPVEDASFLPKDEDLLLRGLLERDLVTRMGRYQVMPGAVQRLPLHVAGVFIATGAAVPMETA